MILDKTLVQSYTNTGVVHIIAISGFHLGLIYWIIGSIIQTTSKKKEIKMVAAITDHYVAYGYLVCWQVVTPPYFDLHLCFQQLLLGETISKKSNIYNTLAFSAFILLCINPFWLWDVGFQLSYAAVLSIVIFMSPYITGFILQTRSLILSGN